MSLIWPGKTPLPTDKTLSHLHRIEDRLLALTTETLSDGKLETLGIRRAAQLDVDDPDVEDACPLFFQPLEDTWELREALRDFDAEVGRREFCFDTDRHASSTDCSFWTGIGYEDLAVKVAEDSRFAQVPKWFKAR